MTFHSIPPKPALMNRVGDVRAFSLGISTQAHLMS